MLLLVLLLLLVQAGLFWVASSDVSLWQLAGLLFLFFVSFNILEASQPSLVSRLAPVASRGAALGLYNTLQSVGFFVGGAVGGEIVKAEGTQGLFLACGAAVVVWLVLGWGLQVPPPKAGINRAA